MPRTGIDGLAEELSRARAAMRARSPADARALELLVDVLAGRAGRALAAAWDERRFQAPCERAGLLLAALRAEARAGGPGHPLWPGLGAETPRPAALDAAALEAVLARPDDRLVDALARRSAREEDPARAIAWRWPAALAGAGGGGRPVALAELGSVAGLGLVADDLAAPWTFPDGGPVPVAAGVRAVGRLGLDPAPLDAAQDEDAAWLRACVPAGDRAAMGRLDAAIAALRAARPRPDAPVLTPVALASAPERLALLSATAPGALVIAWQALLRPRLGREERAELQAGMRAWLATHRPGTALWVELERAPGAHALGPGRAALLTAHVRVPDGGLRSVRLARCALEPSVVVPEPGAAEALAALLAAPAAGTAAAAP
ncbi:conserved hypothetical protein [Anaeromyxobacter sp. K]|uniref:DUF2332 family protein n=1 Tax=Anaeromyxobacter sp. (strain K) TaxID=447217 RepID=UPI00015F90B6|nr:DUF2332 family protein [Anaeromyxobacter sp. K]ACG75592.1 conserved hypothetical protein [Anaeromyxobacter sp. K]